MDVMEYVCIHTYIYGSLSYSKHQQVTNLTPLGLLTMLYMLLCFISAFVQQGACAGTCLCSKVLVQLGACATKCFCMLRML